MEMFSALLALCDGNLPFTSGRRVVDRPTSLEYNLLNAILIAQYNSYDTIITVESSW